MSTDTPDDVPPDMTGDDWLAMIATEAGVLDAFPPGPESDPDYTDLEVRGKTWDGYGFGFGMFSPSGTIQRDRRGGIEPIGEAIVADVCDTRELPLEEDTDDA